AARTGAPFSIVPSVVFDVPKSSPQIDMAWALPEGASVYPLKRLRSTFILSCIAGLLSGVRRIAFRGWLRSIHRSFCLLQRVDESTEDGP
ncbi:MAG TPA: hypothetical protein VGD75_20870, partial [Bradyrhizobium sp.]